LILGFILEARIESECPCTCLKNAMVPPTLQETKT
jgi:hypothetical protein